MKSHQEQAQQLIVSFHSPIRDSFMEEVGKSGGHHSIVTLRKPLTGFIGHD